MQTVNQLCNIGKILRCHDSNPGLLGAKQERYPLYPAAPLFFQFMSLALMTSEIVLIMLRLQRQKLEVVIIGEHKIKETDFEVVRLNIHSRRTNSVKEGKKF